jgi:hypothetical protein
MNGPLHLSPLSSLVQNRKRGQYGLPGRETTVIKGQQITVPTDAYPPEFSEKRRDNDQHGQVNTQERAMKRPRRLAAEFRPLH